MYLETDEDAIKLARDYNVKMLGWNHPDIWWRGGSTESGWNGTLTGGLLWNASEWNDDGSLNTNLPLIRNLEGTAFYADEDGLRKIDYTHPSAVLVAKEKMQKTGVVILCLSSLVLSRIGLKGLVDYVYPLLGALGAIYIIKCAVFKLKKVLSARRASLKNNNNPNHPQSNLKYLQ